MNLPNECANHYNSYSRSHARSADRAEDKASHIDGQLTQVEEAKRLLERQLASLGGRAILKKGLHAQEQLAQSGARLIVWSALDRHTDGSVKTEMFGNGVTTSRHYDHSSQTLDSITTASPTGAPIADLEYEYNAEGFGTCQPHLNQLFDH